MESEIAVDSDLAWEDAGEPRIFVADPSASNGQVVDDVRRLFLAHSMRTGSIRKLAGWRERIVALIPEEVGIKEANAFRTLADGSIETRHTYNVLDAVGTYAGWLQELAMEFGSTDEAIELGNARLGGTLNTIAQAWLMREASEAGLEQARLTLKSGLAMYDRFDDNSSMPIAELARSLYTDRPNLSRTINAARKDKTISEMFAAASR